MKWITPVVAPFMIFEAFTAVILVLNNPGLNLWSINLFGVILIWLSTFFLSVPAHNKLMDTYDSKAAKHLVDTNWIRTLIWSVRSIALFYYLQVYL